MVVDEIVHALYGEQMQAYFDHYEIDLTVFRVAISETEKSLRTLERIVDAFTAFGLVRTEPVLVVGGGLTTDVAGFACATYRRSTNYIRVPTTLIGLIDASVAIKVAVNHGNQKNRLGAYHASQKVFLDFSFLETLPEAQVRNGMAELVKIAVVGQQHRSSRCSRSTARSCCRRASASPTAPPSCGTSATGSPTTRSARCSTSRCRTCTSSTSTG